MKVVAAVFLGMLSTLSEVALAADYPERPISIVVPFGPGGSTDLLTRALGTEMSKVLGQSVVVLNKAGAGGAIGAAEVAAAKPDGYTLGMLPVGPLTTQPNLRRLSYGPDSFDYVCLVYSNPQVLIVRNDSPYKTVHDLIDDAKKNPGRLNYASTGVGSVPHLALAALAKATGIDIVHIPHKGDADTLQSVLGGHVSMFVSHPTFLTTHANSLRGIAVMSAHRLKEYPDLPTLAEQGGPPLDFEVWGGLVAPKGTAAPVLSALEKGCQAGTSSESFRKYLVTLNTPVKYMDGKAFAQFASREFERNGRLLRESGIEKE